MHRWSPRRVRGRGAASTSKKDWMTGVRRPVYVVVVHVVVVNVVGGGVVSVV